MQPFFDSVVKSETQKLVSSKQLFSVFTHFTGTHTSVTYPEEPGFIHFQAFLTSLNSISVSRQPTQCLGEVMCLK